MEFTQELQSKLEETVAIAIDEFGAEAGADSSWLDLPISQARDAYATARGIVASDLDQDVYDWIAEEFEDRFYAAVEKMHS